MGGSNTIGSWGYIESFKEMMEQVCIHALLYQCVCTVDMYICICVLYVRLRVCKYVCVCMYVCIYVHRYVHMYVYIYIYIYIYTFLLGICVCA